MRKLLLSAGVPLVTIHDPDGRWPGWRISVRLPPPPDAQNDRLSVRVSHFRRVRAPWHESAQSWPLADLADLACFHDEAYDELGGVYLMSRTTFVEMASCTNPLDWPRRRSTARWLGPPPYRSCFGSPGEMSQRGRLSYANQELTGEGLPAIDVDQGNFLPDGVVLLAVGGPGAFSLNEEVTSLFALFTR